MAEAGECVHPEVYYGLCTICGKTVKETRNMMNAVGWGQNSLGIRVSEERAAALAATDEERLMRTKKLALLVDLDHTILHSTHDQHVHAAEWLRNGVEELFCYKLGDRTFYTKLRPGVHDFLEEMHTAFELQVYTMGSRAYAEEILKFVDPSRKYFSQRILTQNETVKFNNKSFNLKSLFPSGDHMVLIIDDSPMVWHFRPNLLIVPRYHFFLCAEETDRMSKRQAQLTSKDVERQTRRRYTKAFRRAADHAGAAAPAAFVDAVRSVHGGRADAIVWAVTDQVLAHVEYGEEAEARALFAALNDLGLGESKGLLTAWIAELFEKATKAEATKSSSPTAPAESSRVVTPDTAESAMAVVDAVFEGYKVSFALRETCSNSVMAPRVELTAPSAQGDVDSADLSWRRYVLSRIRCIQDPRVSSDTMSCSLGSWLGGFIALPKELRRAVSSRITCGEYVEAALYLQAAFQLQPEAFAEETAAGDSVRQLFSTLCCGEGETKLRRIPYRGPREEDGHLLGQIGEILHAAQNKFFRQVEAKQSPTAKDVMLSLRPRFTQYPHWVLGSCVIVFTGVIAQGADPSVSHHWRVAQTLGAQVVDRLGPTVTHVVARTERTEKLKQALRIPGIHIVNVEWLDACRAKNARVAERLHPLGSLPTTVPGSAAPETPPEVVPSPEAGVEMMDEDLAEFLEENPSSENEPDKSEDSEGEMDRALAKLSKQQQPATEAVGPAATRASGSKRKRSLERESVATEPASASSESEAEFDLHGVAAAGGDSEGEHAMEEYPDWASSAASSDADLGGSEADQLEAAMGF